MHWRLTNSDYQRSKGIENKRAMQNLVDSGRRPGIIAYHGKRPIGWCAVAPRNEYVRFETSRTLRAIDESPVWSVTCLFIAPDHRRRGLSAALLSAASEFAFSQGAQILEGYPYLPVRGSNLPDVFYFTGFVSAFRKAGFKKVAQPTERRLIMRRYRK